MNILQCSSSVFALLFSIGNSLRRIYGYNKEERCSRLAKEHASVELSSSPVTSAPPLPGFDP